MRKILLIASIAALLATAAAVALAFPGQNEPGKPFQTMFPEISTAELKKMMDGGMDLVLVDARKEDEYAAGHIKGALNVPPEKLQFIASFLPKDKEIPIVFYCRGYG